MADSESPPVRVKEAVTLKKYDVADDGTRTLAETVTIEYENDVLITRRVERADGTVIEGVESG